MRIKNEKKDIKTKIFFILEWNDLVFLTILYETYLHEMNTFTR